jgi:hypothetical protein
MAAINVSSSSDDEQQLEDNTIDLTQDTDSMSDEGMSRPPGRHGRWEVVELGPEQDRLWMQLLHAADKRDAQGAAQGAVAQDAHGAVAQDEQHVRLSAAAKFEIRRNKDCKWLDIFMGLGDDDESDGGQSEEQNNQRQKLAQSFCVAGSDVTDRATRDQLACYVNSHPMDSIAVDALTAFDDRLKELDK